MSKKQAKVSAPSRKKPGKGASNKTKRKKGTGTGTPKETPAKDLSIETATKGTPSDAASQGENQNDTSKVQ